MDSAPVKDTGNYAKIAAVLLLPAVVSVVYAFYGSNFSSFLLSLLFAFLSVVFSGMSFAREKGGRPLAWAAFALGLVYLLAVLCIFLYFYFSDPGDYSRGNI
jgi:VIT1/CCC1 family predicted Fe2+/Mn2+ transporter